MTKTCNNCRHRDLPSDAVPCVTCYLASGEKVDRWEPAAPAPTGEPAAWIRWEWNRTGSKSLVFEKPEAWSLSEQARGVVYDSLYLAPPTTTALEAEVERLQARILGPGGYSEQSIRAQGEISQAITERDKARALLRQAREQVRIASEYLARIRSWSTGEVAKRIASDAIARINALKGK